MSGMEVMALSGVIFLGMALVLMVAVRVKGRLTGKVANGSIEVSAETAGDATCERNGQNNAQT